MLCKISTFNTVSVLKSVDINGAKIRLIQDEAKSKSNYRYMFAIEQDHL